jgi:hypothetical protein
LRKYFSASTSKKITENWALNAATYELNKSQKAIMPWRRVFSTPATEETGAMGREIESRQGIHRVVDFYVKIVIIHNTDFRFQIRIFNRLKKLI